MIAAARWPARSDPANNQILCSVRVVKARVVRLTVPRFAPRRASWTQITLPEQHAEGVILAVSLELSAAQWKVALHDGFREKPAVRTVGAPQAILRLQAVLELIAQHKQKWSLPSNELASRLMGWTPPPEAASMCQSGCVEATT
ncbi:hypothetical protein OKW37_001978 [Paraburkholderia sp. MM5482-R2]